MKKQTLKERIDRVRLLLMDVDGVLTDGTIIYSDGGAETKLFHVKDGLGLRLLMDAGIKAGIITGRSSDALLRRCRNLGIDLVFHGIGNKAAALEKIARETGFTYDQMAFIGDDLPDIPAMKQVGLPVAVADAAGEVRETALIVTEAKGGKGAVRELCETILKSKDAWNRVTERFISCQ